MCTAPQNVQGHVFAAAPWCATAKGMPEAAVSRLYGGIHYRMAIEEGVSQGRRVGELVVRRVKTRAGTTLAERD